MENVEAVNQENLLTEKQISKKHHPWKTIMVYVLVGSLWIIFSDRLLGKLVGETELYLDLQSYKGVFYVIATAIMMYFLIELDYKKIVDLSETIGSKNQELVTFSEELIAMEVELNEKIQALYLTMDELNKQKQFVDEVINSSNTAIMVWNLKGEVIEVNNHFYELFGYDGNDIIGSKWYEVILPKEERYIVSELIKDLKANYSVKNFENRVITKNGSLLDMLWNDTIIREPNTDEFKIVSFGVDITHKKKNERKIYDLAFKDQLTGFDNRTKFEQKIEELIQSNQSFNLFYIDIDNFRKINDIHGHHYGDIFLKHFSNLLKINFPDCQLFRWCGDEFMILETKVDESTLERRIKRLNEIIPTKWKHEHIEYHPSASIGITCFPKDGMTKEIILKNIDVALHNSKESGRAKISMYDPIYQQNIERKLMIENLVYTSLLNDQFKLVIQPIFNIKSKTISGGEILLRLKENQPSINIGELIEIAEETGQIIKVDQWVIKNAFDFITKNLQKSNIMISINLSAKTIGSAETVEFLSECLKEFAIDPKWVEFEITEHSLIDDIDKSIELIKSLKTIGFKVSLDDFGTRYSSLNYLSHMPFDSLKIDKSYVDKIVSNGSDLIIIEQIIQLSKKLGIRTIAEGIEELEQYNELSRIECDFGQGYYLAKPTDFKGFIDLFGS